MIYFVTDGEFVKIGTSNDPHRRISDFQVGNPRALTLIATIEGGHHLEKKIHKILPNRTSGEWFGKSAALEELIDCLNSADPTSSVIAFTEARLAEKAAWLNRFKGKWPEIDAQWRAAVQSAYNDAIEQHGRHEVARVTGVTPNMVRLIARGKAIPNGIPWTRFQAAYGALPLERIAA